MSKTKVSYTDLEIAFSAQGSDYQNWLDKQTGEVISYENESKLRNRRKNG